MIIAGVLGAFNIAFLVFDLINLWPLETKIAISIYDLLIINVSIIIGYRLIYKRLKLYHEDLIEYKQMKPEDVEQLRRSQRLILKFFVLICQHLLFWSVLDIIYIIESSLKLNGIVTTDLNRAGSVLNIITSLSSILMMYGVSDSVRSARRAELKMKKTTISDDEVAMLLVRLSSKVDMN